MALFEAPGRAWENRYNADHYSYRDSHRGDSLFLGAGAVGDAVELATLLTDRG